MTAPPMAAPHTGVVAPLLRDNIDTDALFPGAFITGMETDYGRALLGHLRYHDPDSMAEQPDFVLNRPAYRSATILIAGKNFGCGSSREHAVWALTGFGFRVVLAESFADIFRGNAVKNGLLPIALPAHEIGRLAARAVAEPGSVLTVDLAAQRIGCDGSSIGFPFDPGQRQSLLDGIDDIGLSLRFMDEIRGYQARKAAETPWIYDLPVPWREDA